MKQWQSLVQRRNFLKISSQTGLAVLLGGCLSTQKDSTSSQDSFADTTDDFLKNFGPVEDISGADNQQQFSGDNNTRPHQILWNLPGYLAGKAEPFASEHQDLVIIGGGASGLFSAYTLRDYKPLILEQAGRFGGNAKGQSWRGLKYSLGSAYIDLPIAGSPMARFYKELHLDQALKKRTTVDPIEYKGKLDYDFWNGSLESSPEERLKYRKLNEFFTDLNSAKERPFPHIPSYKEGEFDAVRYYDRWDLHSLLQEVVGGRLPEKLETAIEHYCWSTYAASSQEISAAAALNFLAQESNPICVGAGGNSQITEILVKKLLEQLPQKNLRANAIVVQVKVEKNRVHILYEDQQGQLRKITAKTAILACPKFVAAKILAGIEPKRLAAIKELEYRSYMVANVLIDKKMASGPYDIFRIANGQTDLSNIKAAQAKINATDFVMANFAMPDAPVNALTLYRAFPYSGARQELSDPRAYQNFRAAFEQQITTEILPLLNLKTSDVSELRLTLWGHALPLPKKGIYQGSTIEQLRKPFKDRVFFVEQDNWAYPSLQTGGTESCLLEADIRKVLDA